MQDSKSGALIGQAGVKYGLQRPAAKPKPTSAKAAPPRALNIFGDDDSDDDDVGAQLARQAEKKKRDAKVAQLQAEALAQDANAFSYDEVYDDMHTAKEQPKLQEKLARKPKYIEMLLQQAEQRKREQDIGFERRQVKERQKEDYLFEGKEKFVTAAYRKKLEEDKLWMEAERRKEVEEEANDVRKVGHLGNFYKNLLTNNVAYGTSKGEAAGASGSSAKAAEAGGSAKGAADGGPDAKVLEKVQRMESEMDTYERMRLEAERAYREKKGAAAAATTAAAAAAATTAAAAAAATTAAAAAATTAAAAAAATTAAAGSGSHADEAAPTGRTRELAERDGEERGAPQGEERGAPQGQERGAPQGEEGAGEGTRERPGMTSRHGAAGTGGADAAPDEGGQQPGGAAEGAAVPTGGRRKANEEAISAARERYLARKRLKTGS